MRTKALAPEPVVLRPHEYARFKAVLNAARHPAFIGKLMFASAAAQGGALVYRMDGEDAAVSLSNVRSGILNVLSVDRKYQGRGFGQWIVGYLMPPAVRAIESAEGFFRRQGFVPVFRTQGHRHVVVVMVSERVRRFARTWKATRQKA